MPSRFNIATNTVSVSSDIHDNVLKVAFKFWLSDAVHLIAYSDISD